MIATIEIDCSNCKLPFACDRVPEPQLCSSCALLEPHEHRGTCSCCICQDDGGSAAYLNRGLPRVGGTDRF